MWALLEVALLLYLVMRARLRLVPRVRPAEVWMQDRDVPDDIAQAKGSQSRVKLTYVDELSYVMKEVARGGSAEGHVVMCRKTVQLRAMLFL